MDETCIPRFRCTQASQETEVRSWADRNQHEIVTVCTDSGVAGNLPAADRPGLTDALSLVEAGDADGIVVHGQDRLARALHIQEAILLEAWRSGGHVFMIADGEILQDDPDDPVRTFVRQVMGAVAQLQRSQVIANMRRGRKEKARQGGNVGGFTDRYGYELRDGKWIRSTTNRRSSGSPDDCVPTSSRFRQWRIA